MCTPDVRCQVNEELTWRSELGHHLGPCFFTLIPGTQLSITSSIAPSLAGNNMKEYLLPSSPCNLVNIFVTNSSSLPLSPDNWPMKLSTFLFQKTTSLSIFQPYHKIVKNYEGSEILPNLQANVLAGCIFKDILRKQEVHMSKIKDNLLFIVIAVARLSASLCQYMHLLCHKVMWRKKGQPHIQRTAS